MRTIFLAGGFVGFLLVTVTGLLAERTFQSILRDAAIGAVVGGFLFRWLWGVYVSALSHALQSKRAARRAAEEAEAAAKATPVAPLARTK